MRRARNSLLALALLACSHDEAPRCVRDDDCPEAFTCVREAGVCVRMTTPLEAPDAAPPPDAIDAPPDAPFD